MRKIVAHEGILLPWTSSFIELGAIKMDDDRVPLIMPTPDVPLHLGWAQDLHRYMGLVTMELIVIRDGYEQNMHEFFNTSCFVNAMKATPFPDKSGRYITSAIIREVSVHGPNAGFPKSGIPANVRLT